MTVLSSSYASTASLLLGSVSTAISSSYAATASLLTQTNISFTQLTSSYALFGTPSADNSASVYISGSLDRKIFEIDAFNGTEVMEVSKEGNIIFNTNVTASIISASNTIITSQSIVRFLMINTGSQTVGAPEPIIIVSPYNSYNLLTAHGNVNNYFQVNIGNDSTGTSASSDYVATNNIGTETSFFIDMGINNNNYINNGNGIGTGSDAYLYSTARSLYIGNYATGSLANLHLFSGGPPTSTGVGTELFVSSSGNVGIRTITPQYTLDVSGSINVISNLIVTGSITASTILIGPFADQSASLYISGSIQRKLVEIDDYRGIECFEINDVGQVDIKGAMTASIISASRLIYDFSRGLSVGELTTGFTTNGAYYTWEAPYSCSVTGIRAKRTGGTGAEINARRSGSGGYSLHSAANLSLTTNNSWTSVATIQNPAYISGDSLEIIISGATYTPNQVIVQVNFVKQ